MPLVEKIANALAEKYTEQSPLAIETGKGVPLQEILEESVSDVLRVVRWHSGGIDILEDRKPVVFTKNPGCFFCLGIAPGSDRKDFPRSSREPVSVAHLPKEPVNSCPETMSMNCGSKRPSSLERRKAPAQARAKIPNPAIQTRKNGFHLSSNRRILRG